MSTRIVLLNVVLFVGCGRDQPVSDQKFVVPPATAETKAAVVETKPAAVETKPAIDPFYVLERLREATATVGPEWSLAQSPLTWSTLTLNFGLPFPEDGAAIVWAKWTEPKTALTLEANDKIKSEIEQAVADAIQKRAHVERTFDFNGFNFAVTASAVQDKDMSFVRISFKCVDY